MYVVVGYRTLKHAVNEKAGHELRVQCALKAARLRSTEELV